MKKILKPYLFIFLYLIETIKIYILFVLHVERHSSELQNTRAVTICFKYLG